MLLVFGLGQGVKVGERLGAGRDAHLQQRHDVRVDIASKPVLHGRQLVVCHEREHYVQHARAKLQVRLEFVLAWVVIDQAGDGVGNALA